MNTEEELYQIDCPSGLSGMMSPLRVKDIKMLASKQVRQRGGVYAMDRLFGQIWKKTTEPSIYNSANGIIGQDGQICSWDRVLLGDRTYILYEARRITFGPEFYFSVGCQGCNRHHKLMVDLDQERERFTRLSDQVIETVEKDGISGSIFYFTLPKSGKKVGLKLLTGIEQKNIEKFASSQDEDEDRITQSILARLAYIEGAGTGAERRKFAEELHLLDLEFIGECAEKIDITVPDQIEFDCSCGRIQEVFIPIDDFLSAKSSRQKTRR